MYHGLFHSIMSYRIVFLGGSLEAEIIFLLQRRILWTICYDKFRDSCKTMFKGLQILTFQYVIFFESLLVLNKNPGIYIKNNEDNSRNTRLEKKLHIPQVQSSLRKSGLYHSYRKNE